VIKISPTLKQITLGIKLSHNWLRFIKRSKLITVLTFFENDDYESKFTTPISDSFTDQYLSYGEFYRRCR
jgi:hypothetical protein